MKLLSSWKTGRAAVALGSLSPSRIYRVRLSRSSCPSLDPSGLWSTFVRNLVNFISSINRVAVSLSLSLSPSSRAADPSSSWNRSKLFDVLFAWSLDDEGRRRPEASREFICGR